MEVFEIDIAVLAPHAVYLLDVKGTHGSIDVYGSKWYPEGRQPFHSALAKLRNHAKVIATLIREANAGQVELRKAHGMRRFCAIHDPAGIDGPDVTDIKHCLKYLRDTSHFRKTG